MACFSDKMAIAKECQTVKTDNVKINQMHSSSNKNKTEIL